jgi:3-oxoacyl-[acyl-carrier protein] reductase
MDRRPLPSAAARIVAREHQIDLADDRAVQDAVEGLPELGRFQYVVAIAGGGDPQELAHEDPATEPLAVFSRALENNLHTAFTTIRNTVPLLRKSDGDRSIVLVGSINACGGYGAPGYSAAKAGLIGLANTLAGPLGPDGIRINCLALGTVDTENVDSLAARGLSIDLASVRARAPLRRILTPQDVAAALAALAIDMQGMTGATVTLDNGQTLIR